MNSTLLVRIALLLPPVAALPAQDDVVVRADARCRVFVHPGDLDAALAGRIADEALATLAGIDAVAEPLLGKPRPGVAEVHLYRDVAAYEAADQRVTGGKFQRNLGFTSWDDPHSHLVIQPTARAAVLARTGLPMLTRRLLLHEVGHQLVYRAWPNYRFHPFWLGEGAATWIEDAGMHALGGVGTAVTPHDSKELLRVRKLIGSDTLPTLRDMILGDGKDLDWLDRYACTTLTFQWLRQRAAQPFDRVLARVPAMPGAASLPERLADDLRSAIGASAWQKLDAAFVAHVQQATAPWDEDWRSLTTHATPWVQLGFAASNSMVWRTAAPPGVRLRVRGEVLGGSGQANVLLDRQPSGFVSVAVRVGGGITVLRYRSRNDRWDTIARADVEVAADAPFALQIDTTGSELAVAVDDRLVLRCHVVGHAFTGPWGLGVQAGDGAFWHAVEELPATK